MHLPNSPSRQPESERAEDRRSRGRLRCEMLLTPLGKVVDLSATGVRIEGRGRIRLRPDAKVFLVFRGLDTELKVHSQVVWARQTSMFRYAVGLRFIDEDPEVKRDLLQIAQSAVRKVFLTRGGRPSQFDDVDADGR